MNKYFDQFPDSYFDNSHRIIQTPSQLARTTFFYVQETGYLKIRNSHVATRTNLDSFLIVLVLSGSGTLTYNNQAYPLKKGDSFFINCMIPYCHQSSMEDPWELMWVHFNGSTSPEYYQYFSSISSPAFSPRSFQELRGKLESLLDVNSSSGLSTEITSSRLIVDILSILLEDITQLKEEKNPNLSKMAEVRNYLDEHYVEKFSLDELSQKFFISKYHLSREFNQCYGITLNQYVIAKRITYAKKLLRFSRFSLEQIAQYCGFYDTSYMNKQFKKSEGISASDFRKKWLSKHL